MVGRNHHASGIVLTLALVSLAATGCGRQLESSAQARPLPAVERDALESADAPRDWPGWRGVNASGVSACTGLPVQWTTERGIRWKIDVPGRGNSSPVVWGDSVIVTSALEESVGTGASTLVINCYDRRSGERRWQAEAGQAAGGTHNKNGYASASVATDGRSVFASFGSAGLIALDLVTGEPKWRAELGVLEHQWGTASSPVVIDNLVVQLCDSQANSSLAAFDKETGKEIWHTPRESTGSWSTPVLVDVAAAGEASRRELIVNGTGTEKSGQGWVIAYDPADGRELWRVQGTTHIPCPTAILGAGLVISTSGRNGPIIAIQPGGAGDVTKANVVWRQPRGGAYVPTAIAYRNRLYSVGDGGVAACFNLGSGELVWRERLKGNFTASLVAGDGKLYAASEQGIVYVLAAGDNFQVLAENDMQDRILATPAIAEGDIFLRTESKLYCVEAAGQ